jgi:hypothetical protein
MGQSGHPLMVGSGGDRIVHVSFTPQGLAKHGSTHANSGHTTGLMGTHLSNTGHSGQPLMLGSGVRMVQVCNLRHLLKHGSRQGKSGQIALVWSSRCRTNCFFSAPATKANAVMATIKKRKRQCMVMKGDVAGFCEERDDLANKARP